MDGDGGVWVGVFFQALLQKEAEKAVLVEKLSGLQQDLVSAGLDLQQARREAQARLEQDEVHPQSLSFMSSS